jgi:prepilin-type processing-associated H-X9-DG protein
MVSEDFNVKFGRMNFGFGDGSVMSVNDWEQQPFSFEGVLLNYEAEFGRFHAFGFKYKDFYVSTGAAGLNSDPQHDAYALIFDLKTMPEWLKTVNVFVIQDVSDAVTTVNPTGNNALRYGLGLGMNFDIVDVKADYVQVTGKQTSLTAAKTDIEASMWQAEVGVNVPTFIGSRFFVGYHQDTGAKATDTKVKTYDAYFYEQHENAGLMDIVGWGNLTDLYIGWTAKPMDNTTAGLAYHMFSKTEKEGAATAGKYGNVLFTSATANESALGNEIDLWAEHNYGNGFSVTARLGQFMPGKALKNLDTSNTVERKDSITQAMLEAKLTF